jgi:hypothetical protein
MGHKTHNENMNKCRYLPQTHAFLFLFTLVFCHVARYEKQLFTISFLDSGISISFDLIKEEIETSTA